MNATATAPSAAPAPTRVVPHHDWLAARRDLLAREKEYTKLRDELSRQRRALPWEKVDKAYTFETPAGRVTLADLFGPRHQLVVYHFMLGPGWEEGCKSCSMIGDSYDGITTHLKARDVAFTAVSRAPLAEIQAFKRRMGWKFDWASSYGTDFNRDYQVSFTADELATGKVYYNYGPTEFPMEEAPGVSVFAKDASGTVYHTYSTYGRGLDHLMHVYQILDLVPKGRDEAGYEVFPMEWVRHHDKYEFANA